MKFAAHIQYSPDKELIAKHRPKHREYLLSLLSGGQLLAAGPIEGDRGALIIYESASADDATQLLRADPFFAAGVFVSYELLPWKAVMGNRQLLPDGFQP